MNIKSLTLTAALLSMLSANADCVFYMPMEVNGNQVTETVSGKKYQVEAANAVESVAGAKGNALRLDGYSNFITAEASLGTLSKFTFSLWCAMETWPGEVTAAEPLPLYQWNNLVASCNGSKVTVYNNGVVIGSANCKGVSADGTFMIGKGVDGRKMGQFCLNTVNGIIDEVELYNEATEGATIQGWKAESEADLAAVGAGHYDEDLMRPTYHGMPTRNWTNETHGLVYYDNRYHLFFQKNANGPYMSRLQWGHLVSDNLYQWEEMPIAIGSDKWYGVEAFSDGGTTQANIKAWSLDPKSAGINDVANDSSTTSEYVDVYNTMGIMVRSNALRSEALADLPHGLYIVNGQKFIK